jgi:hypothetical protein
VPLADSLQASFPAKPDRSAELINPDLAYF